MIFTEEWKQGWTLTKDDTSSSESGLHFGRYKAGAKSKHISHFHVLKASIEMCKGLFLDHLGCGISVMLEKAY